MAQQRQEHICGVAVPFETCMACLPAGCLVSVIQAVCEGGMQECSREAADSPCRLLSAEVPNLSPAGHSKKLLQVIIADGSRTTSFRLNTTCNFDCACHTLLWSEHSC